MSGKILWASTLRGNLERFSSSSLHSHDFHQILFIRKGVSLLELEGVRKTLCGAVCAFLPAGVAHRTVVVGKNLEYNSLYLREEGFTLPAEVSLFVHSKLGKALFDKLIEGGLDIDGNAIPHQSLVLFLSLINEEFQEWGGAVDLPVPRSEQSRLVVEYLEAGYNKALSLDSLKSVLPYSSRHIGRLFKEDMGMSPFEYLRMYRIFKASVALTNSSDRITDVSLGCGYESLSSFYTDFTKLMGASPSRFRKLNR